MEFLFVKIVRVNINIKVKSNSVNTHWQKLAAAIFFLRTCRSNLPCEFVIAVCQGNLLEVFSVAICYVAYVQSYQNQPFKVLKVISVLKDFSKLNREHLCKSLILTNVQPMSLKVQSGSCVFLLRCFPFLWNISRRLIFMFSLHLKYFMIV